MGPPLPPSDFDHRHVISSHTVNLQTSRGQSLLVLHCLHLRLSLSLSLRCLPPFPPQSVLHAHTCQFLVDLFLVKRDLVGLFGGGPEALCREAVVEIRAEVIHPADGEKNVHSELWVGQLLARLSDAGHARFLLIDCYLP